VNLPPTIDTETIAEGLRDLATAQRNQDPQVFHIQAPEVTVEQPQITVEAAHAPQVTVEPAVVNADITLAVPSRSVTVRREDGKTATYTEEPNDEG
jgi:hypothetical protein